MTDKGKQKQQREITSTLIFLGHVSSSAVFFFWVNKGYLFDWQFFMLANNITHHVSIKLPLPPQPRRLTRQALTFYEKRNELLQVALSESTQLSYLLLLLNVMLPLVFFCRKTFVFNNSDLFLSRSGWRNIPFSALKSKESLWTSWIDWIKTLLLIAYRCAYVVVSFFFGLKKWMSKDNTLCRLWRANVKIDGAVRCWLAGMYYRWLE